MNKQRRRALPKYRGNRQVEIEHLETRELLAVTLVKDINALPADGSIAEITAAGSTLFFVADDQLGRRALWKSDGTADGTAIVKGNFDELDSLVVFDDEVYFHAQPFGNSIAQFWKSDGAPEGTVVVGTSLSSVNRVRSSTRYEQIADSLYAMNNYGLFRMDGVDGGFEDLGFGGGWSDLVRLGDYLYFTEPSSSDVALVRVNSTDGEYSIVARFAQGSSNVYGSRGHLLVDGEVLFVLTGGRRDGNTFVKQLWRTNGAEGGETLLHEAIVPANTGPEELLWADGRLYFTIEDAEHGRELWVSDGTVGGTMLLKDVAVGLTSSNARELRTVGGKVVFVADDAIHGAELWTTDGSEEGTRLFLDINPNESGASPANLTSIGNTLYFAADDGVHGSELWRTDGTPEGTWMVNDIATGTTSSTPGVFTSFAGEILMTASDGTTGVELWKSNGELDNAEMVADVVPGTQGSFSRFTVSLGSIALFTFDDGIHGEELWRTDGTDAGTQLVADLMPGDGRLPLSSPVVAHNGVAYFTLNDPQHGEELWRSDGTELGTHIVSDIYPGPLSSAPERMAFVDDLLYFSASGSDLPNVFDLWVSDGTSEGTLLVSDEVHNPRSFTRFDDKVYFGANEGLCSLDEGTNEISCIAGYKPDEIAAVDNFLYFTGQDKGLYRLDAASQQVTALFTQGRARDLTELGSLLVFRAETVENGKELWRTDGSNQGTFMLRDFLPGPNSGYPENLTRFGNRIYFGAWSTTHGHEPWSTDGTVQGTTLLRDINPGNDGSFIRQPVPCGAFLYFAANDNVHGSELWRSDGTSSGTMLVQDLLSGSYSGLPLDSACWNGTLLMNVNADATARELYRVDLPPGDVDGDDSVNLQDLNYVLNNFGGAGPGDTNGDGIVDLVDLNAVRNNFGMTTQEMLAQPAQSPMPLVSLKPVHGFGGRPMEQPVADREERQWLSATDAVFAHLVNRTGHSNSVLALNQQVAPRKIQLFWPVKRAR